MRLVLIGFRGVGKTTLAEALSTRLGIRCFSTDVLVAERCGTSIANYVQLHGWEEFRNREEETIVALNEYHSCIIDCGGGVIERERNMQMLATNSLIVWVDADTEDIVRRIEHQSSFHRPLLSQGTVRNDVLENYRRRKPLYEQYAQCCVNTSQETLEESVQRVVQAFSIANSIAGR